MFNKLYIGELKKLLRPKTLITLAVVMLVFLIIYALSYDFMVNMQNEMTIEMENEVVQESEEEEPLEDALFGAGIYGKRKYTAEEMPTLIAAANQMVAAAEEARNENSFFMRMSFDSVYEYKSYLKALEYIRDKKVYNEEIEIYSNMTIYSEKSAEGFMKGFFSIFVSIMAIYGVVIGAGSYAGEMKNGTLKMLFMRPITRNKLTSAKLLSLLTMITIIIGIGVILSYLYGIIRFGAAATQKSVFVFNAMSAFMGTNRLGLFLNILFGVLQVLAMCIFAFALGTVTKNRILALITGIVLQLGFIATILSLLKMGRFLFTTSSNLGIYFGVTSVIPAGGSFFIALPVLIAYLAVFLMSAYVVFNKRDIA